MNYLNELIKILATIIILGLLMVVLALISVQEAQADEYDNPPDYRTEGPRLYAPDGTYLGNVNSNKYDPNSISNPYGHYGNKYSPDSVNNPYGQYGNPYSSQYSKPRN